MSALAVALCLVTLPAFGQQGSAAQAERLLERLVGEWIMTGEVHGELVQYRLSARRVLNRRFVELHMIDVRQPAKFEARVFLGHDPDADRLIAHWLDSFGAAYSVPHGVGTASADTIRFEVPYASGAFRDTFVFDAQQGTWRFVLESNHRNGGWDLFAEYKVRTAETRDRQNRGRERPRPDRPPL